MALGAPEPTPTNEQPSKQECYNWTLLRASTHIEYEIVHVDAHVLMLLSYSLAWHWFAQSVRFCSVVVENIMEKYEIIAARQLCTAKQMFLAMNLKKIRNCQMFLVLETSTKFQQNFNKISTQFQQAEHMKKRCFTAWFQCFSNFNK